MRPISQQTDLTGDRKDTQTDLGDHGADLSDPRPRETRIDSGASDDFADDRRVDDNTPETEQAGLFADPDADPDQRTLDGERAIDQCTFGGE